MDKFIENFKEEGCKNCVYYEEKEKLVQNDNGSKILDKNPYCKLLK